MKLSVTRKTDKDLKILVETRFGSPFHRRPSRNWAGAEAAPVPLGGAAWRWMFVTVSVFAVGYALIVRRLPPSPHDLMRAGDEGGARGLLSLLGPGPVDEQVIAIQHGLSGSRQAVSLSELRGSRLGLQPIVWTGILLAAFQQLLGINVVKTYSNAIWRAVGFSKRQRSRSVS